jgi:hypothetical protein
VRRFVPRAAEFFECGGGPFSLAEMPAHRERRIAEGFVEGDVLYEGAGLRHQDHIQLCVRDTSCIVGYFLPRVK